MKSVRSNNLRLKYQRFRLSGGKDINLDLRYFKTMKSVRSNNLRLKYLRVRPSGGKDIKNKKFEFCGNFL